MKKILSILIAISCLLATSPVFADSYTDNSKFNELKDKFDIVEKTFATYQIIREFNSEGYTVDEDSFFGYTTGLFDYNGNEIIPSEYNYLELFYEDLAVAQKFTYGKYGYIDRENKWSIPPTFDMCDRFSEGLAYVYKNGTAGYIDKTGKLVHVLEEDEYGSRFNNGMAIINDFYSVKIINKNFEVINEFPLHESNNISQKDDRFILWE